MSEHTLNRRRFMRTAVGGVVARSLAASQRGGAAPACNNKIIAIQAGADGLILSRKYSEMRLDALSGAGDAVKELGLA